MQRGPKLLAKWHGEFQGVQLSFERFASVNIRAVYDTRTDAANEQIDMNDAGLAIVSAATIVWPAAGDPFFCPQSSQLWSGRRKVSESSSAPVAEAELPITQGGAAAPANFRTSSQ